jgi:hypothetical protein
VVFWSRCRFFPLSSSILFPSFPGVGVGACMILVRGRDALQAESGVAIGRSRLGSGIRAWSAERARPMRHVLLVLEVVLNDSDTAQSAVCRRVGRCGASTLPYRRRGATSPLLMGFEYLCLRG